jgi:hypothetical protein
MPCDTSPLFVLVGPGATLTQKNVRRLWLQLKKASFTMPRMSELRTVVENFTNQLAQVIEAQIMERARHAVAAALGGNGHIPARRGRPPKSAALVPAWTPKKKPRKKAPKQLCPVPGCSNPAAPVFGMVCAKHKDLPKLKIRKFREARRAKKMGGAAAPKKQRRVAAKARKKIVRRKKAAAAPAAAAAAPATAS